VLSALRHRLRRLSWIAFLAIFGLAIVPTISHALAHASGESAFTEICTPQGMRQVSVAAQGNTAPAAPSMSHLDHCPMCGLGASPVALLPVAPVVLAPVDPAHLLPALFLHAPQPLFAWASAQPRAPPSAS
jgi:hypothetical protein